MPHKGSGTRDGASDRSTETEITGWRCSIHKIGHHHGISGLQDGGARDGHHHGISGLQDGDAYYLGPVPVSMGIRKL